MPLIASITKAYSENRIEQRLKFCCQPKLLIVDEIGHIPFDRHGAHLFFQLISLRSGNGALILTSNRSFSKWNEIFGNPVIATAILYRILHHSTTANVKNNSYSFREKVKARLIREPEVEESYKRTGGIAVHKKAMRQYRTPLYIFWSTHRDS